MSDERFGHRATVLDPPHREKAEDSAISGIVLGRLVTFTAPDSALVTLNGRPSAAPIAARSLTGLTAKDEGREVALMFEEGDSARPLIIGRIEAAPGATLARTSKQPVSIEAESIVLTGEQKIVLRCGEATLTLTRDGKLILRGAYVETLATGVNRIKGGCVKIN